MYHTELGDVILSTNETKSAIQYSVQLSNGAAHSKMKQWSSEYSCIIFW